MSTRFLIASLCLALASCAEPAEEVCSDLPPEPLQSASQAVRVDRVSGCSLAAVRGLDAQIVAEMNCVIPDTLVPFDDLNVELGGSSTWPLLQPAARAAFGRAIAARGASFRVNSAYRTIAQQYLLYQWYRAGQCGIGLAAQPGRSNHQSGLSLDVSDYPGWRPHLEAQGWDWFGSGDPVHFDYVGGGTADIRDDAVLAFQRLHNRNNPGDLIAEDGAYGPQTESRLKAAPAEGFAVGADCEGVDPDPDPDPDPTDVHITLDAAVEGPNALVESGASEGVADLLSDDKLRLDFIVRNGAGRPVTDEVRLGFDVVGPAVRITGYTIYTDHPALDGATWLVNDANGAEGNPDHADPGRSGEFNLNRFSAGESKRVELEIIGLDPALGNRATVRTWVRHVGGYYGEMESWDDEVEVNLREELLRVATDVDVFSGDHWNFPGPGPEDTDGWTACGELAITHADGALHLQDGACAQSPPWTSVDGETFPAMALRMRGTAPSVTLTWDGGTSPVALAADGAWHDVTAPYQGDDLWRGHVTQLEVRASGGEVEIDSIGPSRTADPAPEPTPLPDAGTDSGPDAGPDPAPDPGPEASRNTRTDEGCSCRVTRPEFRRWLRRR